MNTITMKAPVSYAPKFLAMQTQAAEELPKTTGATTTEGASANRKAVKEENFNAPASFNQKRLIAGLTKCGRIDNSLTMGDASIHA